MLVGAAGLVACYPGLTRFETGRPLRAGENQLAAGVSLTAVGDHAAREDEASQALSDVPIIAPQPELSLRYGVTDTFDVGFRMSFGTLGVTSSVGLLDSGAVAVALLPGITYGTAVVAEGIYVDLPIVISVQATDNVVLLGGGRVIAGQMGKLVGERGADDLLGFGALAGVSIESGGSWLRVELHWLRQRLGDETEIDWIQPGVAYGTTWTDAPPTLR